MKKIGILTYFWADNPGTFLQAFSTLKVFKEKFPQDQVELIDFKHRNVSFEFKKAHVNLKYFIDDLQRYIKYKRFRKKYLSFSYSSLVSQDYEQTFDFLKKQRYDLIIVGADTILNPLQHNIQNQTLPIYWLPAALKCKKVMCASSASSLTYDNLNIKNRMALKESINSFDLLGVRDHATYDLIGSLGLQDKTKLYMVPDPTVTYDFNYNCAIKLSKKIDTTKPTIVVNIPGSFTLAPKIAAHFKKKGFQIITLNRVNYGDTYLTAISPFEWAVIPEGAQLVITDRFHGALFSLKNLTPVISLICSKNLVTKNGLSKHFSLLESFGLYDTNSIMAWDIRHVSPIIQMAEKAMLGFDQEYVKNKLIQLST